MSRHRVSAAIDGSVVVVRGWLAHKLAIEAGLRPVFSGAASGGGGWVFDAKNLSTFEAYCAHRHVALDVTDLEPKPVLGTPSSDSDPHHGDIQVDLPLFGGDGAA